MRKIPTLFQRNYDTDRLVRNEVTPGCEWVLTGEGIATEKIDGTCCLIKNGKLFKRYELKKGRTAPAGFEPAQATDEITGDIPGWVPIGTGPEDRWHREAWLKDEGRANGTYELIGPKIQGNLYNLVTHDLWKHGSHVFNGAPRTFDLLLDYLSFVYVEGIVWYADDGRMAKLKRRDYGLEWPIKDA